MSLADLQSRQPLVMELEGLTQRLFDRGRGDEFVVTVGSRLAIPSGSLTALLGPSGCGKTTLLSVMGLLRRPSNLKDLKSFRIWVTDDGADKEYNLKEIWEHNRKKEIDILRRQHIGFALQSGELLESLTVRENIAVPLRLNGITGNDCWTRVEELMKAFGLTSSSNEDPSNSHADEAPMQTGSPEDVTRKKRSSRLPYSRVDKLSGGEYQRVALARAIAHRPALVFVDEPTSSLNRKLARAALTQLRSLQKESPRRNAIIMITHDDVLAKEFADLILTMDTVEGRPAGYLKERAINTPTSPILGPQKK